MISRHGFFGDWRMRRPTAFAGSPQNSRAKILADHHDRRAAVHVAPGDRSAGDERIAHRFEVALADPLEAAKRRESGLRRREVLDEDRVVAADAVHRHRRGHANTGRRHRWPRYCCAICSCVRATCAGSAMTASGIEMRSVSTSSGCAKPGETSRIARNVRTIRPDATSSTTASATCATTSVLRARCRSRPSLEPRPLSFSALARRGPRVLQTPE